MHHLPSTRDADVLRLLAQVADLRERIGERIKEARDAKGWKQVDLARALPGRVEASSVSRWERGRVKPEDDTLEVIAKLLGVDVSYFYVDEPVAGTTDLMGALHDADPVRLLQEINAKLDVLLKQLGADGHLDLAGALASLDDQAPDRTAPEAPASRQAPARRRRSPRAA